MTKFINCLPFAFSNEAKDRHNTIVSLISQYKDLLPKTCLGYSEYRIHVDICSKALDKHNQEPNIPIETWVKRFSEEFEEATIGILEP